MRLIRGGTLASMAHEKAISVVGKLSLTPPASHAVLRNFCFWIWDQRRVHSIDAVWYPMEGKVLDHLSPLRPCPACGVTSGERLFLPSLSLFFLRTLCVLMMEAFLSRQFCIHVKRWYPVASVHCLESPSIRKTFTLFRDPF